VSFDLQHSALALPPPACAGQGELLHPVKVVSNATLV